LIAGNTRGITARNNATPEPAPAGRAPVSPAALRSKVWLERDGAVLLSEWRIALLEEVAATGSLAAAAERLGVPYRTAWQRVKEMEDRLGAPLLATASGGADGGHSHLTPLAADLVARFRRATAGLADLLADRFHREFPDLLPATGRPD
jgi:molybdate transport system regulatory protein